MNQKSSKKRFLALFVAVVMATLFSVVAVSAQNTFEIGQPDQIESNGWANRWNTEDTEEAAGGRIPLEKLEIATHLVLELSDEPQNDVEIIIMGEGNNWGWTQRDAYLADYEANAGNPITIEIDLEEIFGDVWTTVRGGGAALIVGCAGLADILDNAYLILEGGGGTETPQPTESPEPTVSPQPTASPQAPSTSVLQLTLNSQNYTLNGVPGTLEVAAKSVDGRTLVPLRFIGETLGAKVDWNDATRTATFTLGTNSTSVTIGQPLPGGMGTPVIEGGRTLVPVAFVSQAMGAEVEWVPPSTVIITFGGEANTQISEEPPAQIEEPTTEEPTTEEPTTEEPVGNDPVSSDNAPTGNVLRATLINKDASVQLTGDFKAGNEYTIAFWFYNAAGNSDVQVEWSHWPDISDEIGFAESAAGEWVYHEMTFEALPNAELVQIAPAYDTRKADNVFYVSDVTITAADGSVQNIPVSALRGHWESSVIGTAVVPAP